MQRERPPPAPSFSLWPKGQFDPVKDFNADAKAGPGPGPDPTEGQKAGGPQRIWALGTIVCAFVCLRVPFSGGVYGGQKESHRSRVFLVQNHLARSGRRLCWSSKPLICRWRTAQTPAGLWELETQQKMQERFERSQRKEVPFIWLRYHQPNPAGGMLSTSGSVSWCVLQIMWAVHIDQAPVHRRNLCSDGSLLQHHRRGGGVPQWGAQRCAAESLGGGGIGVGQIHWTTDPWSPSRQLEIRVVQAIVA